MRFLVAANESIIYADERPREAEYSSLLLPAATVHQTRGPFGTIISQHIAGNDFSVWKHDLLIREAVVLHPSVKEQTAMLHYMLNGNLQFELSDGSTIGLDENRYSLYQMSPGLHSCWLEPGSYSCLHFELGSQYMTDLEALLGLTVSDTAREIDLNQYAIDHNVRLLLRDIMNCKDSGNHRSLFIRSRIYDLLLILSRVISNDAGNVFRVDEVILEEIRLYLEEHLHLPLTLSDLSRSFGISQASLRKHFKICYQISVHQYLIRARMKAGAQLLKEKNMSVRAIAEASGYPDISSFTRAFTAFYGKSPSTYKQDLRRGIAEA